MTSAADATPYPAFHGDTSFVLQSTRHHDIADTRMNKKGQLFAKLILLTNVPGLPQEMEIRTPKFRIGRDRNQVDMHLDPTQYDRMISRVHCTVIAIPGDDSKYHFKVIDNKSVNGTFVNATRVENSILEDGDFLVFTGGSAIAVGCILNPNINNKITSNETEKDLSTLSRQDLQELLLNKLTNAFIYKFVIIDDNVYTNTVNQTHDDTSLNVQQNTSMNGEYTATKRKFDDIDSNRGRSIMIKQEYKRFKTDEDALRKHVAELEMQLKESTANLTKEREDLQKQIVELQTKLNEERTEKENRIKEAEERIAVLQQQAAARAINDTALFPIKDIEDEFTCAICQELIVNATTLQCSHTFCKTCLAEWLKQKKMCPVCRKRLTKYPTRNLTMENVLDKLMKNLPVEEQENRIKRRREIIEAEERASQKLKELVESARSRGVKFLNLQDPWSVEERRVFKTGVSKHEGRARLMYCELTGFNAEWIKKATTQMIVRACHNLDIEIPKTKVESSSPNPTYVLDYEMGREKLLDFLEGDNVLLLN